jgi:hypothetical protein
MNLPVELIEYPDLTGMYSDKSPWFLEPSAMSLAWTPESMSTLTTRVIGRAISTPLGMFLPQDHKGALYSKVAQS